MRSATWYGRRGPVLLGPTEDRVARYLADATRHGRVTLAIGTIREALGLERSEAYRITARLRVLGLFGVENDQGGAKGGRRYWRTAREHDGPGLDPDRHRRAWSRIVGWSRRLRARVAARLAALRSSNPAAVAPPPRAGDVAGPAPGRAGSATFADRMRAAGLGRLMDEWRIGT